MENTSERGRHQGFAEADDVAEYDTAAFFQMTCGDANGGGLKFQQGAAHIRRDGEFGQTGAGFLGQVISHLDINMIRRGTFRSRPTFVNHLNEFLGDVNAPAVFPAILEPVRQFLRRVMVEHVYVKFALIGQA